METATFYTELGKNIKNYRTKLGYSQDELAKFLDLTRTSIVNIEKGRQRPPLHTVYDLSVFFDVDITDLLPSRSEQEQSDIRRSVDENLKIAENKFNELAFDHQKLARFFQISSKNNSLK